MSYWADILFIILLIFINGFFSMSELAIMSSRRLRLKSMAELDVPGAAMALTLCENPGPFLSTVQVGITIVGIFAGVYGGEQLAPPLSLYIARLPVLAPFAEAISVSVIIVSITYITVVLGELVPKHLAIHAPERIATMVAPIMTVLAKVMLPPVYLLETSSRLLLQLLGSPKRSDILVSDEELRALVSEGVRTGVLEPQEQDMIRGVMRLADWKVRTIKTPRAYLDWLDLNDSTQINRDKILATPFSRLIVTRGGLAHPLGIVQSRDLLHHALLGHALNIEQAICKPVYVYDGTSALELLELVKNSPMHMAIVLDPRSAVNGVITTFDILKHIVGGFKGTVTTVGPQVIKQGEGTWLMDGDLHLDVARDTLGLLQLPADASFHTLAGFMLTHFDRLPEAGDYFNQEGYRFEVAHMDAMRIDKVLVTVAEPEADDAG